MKANVNQELCAGGQGCVNTCPEVFKMKEDKAMVHVAEVPKDVEGKCKTAAEECPTNAITVE